MDEDKTSEQSNLDEPENPTGAVDQVDTSVDNQQAPEGDEEVQGDDIPERQTQSRSERRHDSYISKLSQEIRQASQAEERRTGELFNPQPYQPLQYQEGDYEPEQLEKDRQTYGQNQFSQGIQTGMQQGTQAVRAEQWADRLDIDGDRVHAMYPDLDEVDEKGLTQKYLNFIGYQQQNGRVVIGRPEVRYRDFVQAEMQEREDYANRKLAASSKNVAQQASRTGVRPGGQSRPSKGLNVDTSDPNWISKMSREDWENGGRELADKEINSRLGIR